MAAALAPAALEVSMLVGSTQANEFVVTIDEKTFTPAVRDTLRTAKHWAILTDPGGGNKFENLLEEKGGIRISPQTAAKNTTDMIYSERRAALTEICGKVKSDIAMLMTVDAIKETGTLGQAFMGRSQHLVPIVVNVFACRAKDHSTFNISVVMNRGQFAGQSPREQNDAINLEIGNRLLVALDLPTSKVGAADSAATSNEATGGTKGSKINATMKPKAKATAVAPNNAQ